MMYYKAEGGGAPLMGGLRDLVQVRPRRQIRFPAAHADLQAPEEPFALFFFARKHTYEPKLQVGGIFER